jgi:hypothetical protein
VVDSIARMKRYTPTLGDVRVREQLARAGFIADTANRIDAEIAHWLANPSLQPTPEDATSEHKAWLEKTRPYVLESLEKLRATRQLLAECADEAALIGRIEQSHRDYAAWRDGVPPRVAALRERILAHALDTAMAAEDWEALRTVLQSDRHLEQATHMSLAYGFLRNAPARVRRAPPAPIRRSGGADRPVAGTAPPARHRS